VKQKRRHLIPLSKDTTGETERLIVLCSAYLLGFLLLIGALAVVFDFSAKTIIWEIIRTSVASLLTLASAVSVKKWNRN